jgi:hypothetical protein
MDIQTILVQRFSGAQYVLVGNPQSSDEYEKNLTWLGDDSKPTWNDLVYIWPEVEDQTVRDAIREARQVMYQQTVDPLFFKYQRGEATEKEWLAAVEAVKDANPYPVRAS